MNINSKISNKLKEKLLTPRISKKKRNSKQKKTELFKILIN